MARFPGFPFRKDGTAAAGAHQKILTRLAALGMSFPCWEPRNLTYAGSGANTYPDWVPNTLYTMAADTVDAHVCKHGGSHWVQHTTQPTGLTTFPGIAYWYRCLPLLGGADGGFDALWADVTKTTGGGAAAASKALFLAEKAAGNPVNVFTYAYFFAHASDGSMHGIDSRSWLDANNGWLYCDGEVQVNTTKAGTLNGTATVACSDTTMLTPHMHVSGGGLPNAHAGGSVKIGTITPNTSFTLVTAEGGVPTVPNAGSVSLTFSNRVKPASSTPGNSAYNINPATYARRRDSSGQTYVRARCEQYKSSGTYADYMPYLAGFACDDTVGSGLMSDTPGSNTNPYWPWAQDASDQSFSHEHPTQGTAHHRLGVLEIANTTAAWAAWNEGVRLMLKEIRTAFPHFRSICNAGVKNDPVLHSSYATDNGMHSVLFEGWGSYYSPESQLGYAGWLTGLQLILYTTKYKAARRRRCGAMWNWKTYDNNSSPSNSSAQPVAQPRHKDYLFALCSTLLTDAHFAFTHDVARSGGYGGGRTERWPVEVRFRMVMEEVFTPLGVPVEDAPETPDGNGVLARAYSNGLVLVRPKGNNNSTWGTAADVSYTLPFNCRRLTGTLDPADDGSLLPAGSTISMSPRQGRILLRA